MKKAFIAVLGFYLFFHILGPYFYQLKYGFIHYLRQPFDLKSINLVVLMNTIVILLAILIILVIPGKKKTEIIKLKGIFPLYIFSLAFSYLALFIFKGFSGILAGSANGTFFSYASMFLNSGVLLFLLLAGTENKAMFIGSASLFVIVRSFGGSRSSVLSVIIIILMLFATKDLKKMIKPAIVFLSIGIVLTPFLFFWATYQRNGYLEKNKVGYFMEIVVQRISHLESGAIPVFNKNSIGENLQIFYEKYGIVKQSKLALNAMVPGDIFLPDVDPNQYYRSAFLGYSEELSSSYYTSINMTLPVYFFMYGNVFFSILISLALILALYALSHVFPDRLKVFNFAFLLILYELLTYFDFVMVVRRFLYIVCTISLAVIISMIYQFITSRHKRIT